MGCQSEKSKIPEEGFKIKTRSTDNERRKVIEAKVVLLGEPAVGKSSIAQRFCKNTFTDEHIATIGGTYLQQNVFLQNGETIKLHIWDTGGQERFRSMASLYYRDAAAAILIYDVTQSSSLKGLEFWIGELAQKIGNTNYILSLAGNKCDCDSNERQLNYDDGKEFAEKNHMIFRETSAKNNIGIKDLFNELALKIYEIKKTETPC